MSLINQNILRKVDVKVGMKRMGKTIRTGAVFNQKDSKTSILMCTILFNGNVDLTGCNVIANILKPDGTKVVQAGQVVDAENGLVAIGLTEQCLSAVGEVLCELVIQSDTQVLHSPQMSFDVVDNLFDLEDEEIESNNEFPVLNGLIRDVQQIKDYVLELNEVITSNEDIRQGNETQRQEFAEKLKNDFDELLEGYNEKAVLIDSEIKRLTKDVGGKLDEVNVKIAEVNDLLVYADTSIKNSIATCRQKIQEVDSTVADKMDYVDYFINKKNTELKNKVDEVNTKITEFGEEIAYKFNNINSTLNKKVEEVNQKLVDANTFLNEKSVEVDKKFNKKSAEIDVYINSKMSEVDSKMLDHSNEFNAKVSEVDEKLVEATDKISEINSTINDNVSLVDRKIVELDNNIRQANSTIDENVQLVESKINDISSVMNNKISEVDISVENKIGEINSTMNNKINEVNSAINNKISEINISVENKINNVNEIISGIEQAEVQRNNSEKNRVDNYNKLVSEFTVTQEDLDDILNMIGGL